MSIKLAGDLYLTNISACVGSPVETSIKLYEKIVDFLRSLGLKERYGSIDYIIVKGSTKNQSKQTYVAFLSLEDSSKHYELKENLANFHFYNEKVHVKINQEEMDPQTKANNKQRFKLELNKRSNQTKKTNELNNKRRREDSSTENLLPQTKRPIVQINDESNDSFSSVIEVKSEPIEQTNKLKDDEISELKIEIEALKQKMSELEAENTKADMKIYALEIKWRYEQAANQHLLKKREEVALMAKQVFTKLNKEKNE